MWRTLGRHNQLWKDWRKRLGRDLALVEGAKLIGEVLASDWQVEALLSTDPMESNWADTDVSKYAVETRSLKNIAGAATPQGVLALASPPRRDLESLLESVDFVLYLEQLQDPANVGALLRSGRAFGAGAVLLEGGASPTNSKVVRASGGAVFHLPWSQVDGARLKLLKERGFGLLATVVRDGEDLRTVPLPNKVALILGNEGKGLRSETLELCDRRLTVPMVSGESLNVAVCGAICMFWCYLASD